MRPGRISAFRADFGLILFDNASQSAPRRAYFRSGNILEQPRLFACNSPGATFLHATRGSTLQVEVICTASAEKSQPAVTAVMLRGPDRADFVDLIQNVSKIIQRRFGGPVENVSKTFQKMLKTLFPGGLEIHVWDFRLGSGLPRPSRGMSNINQKIRASVRTSDADTKTAQECLLNPSRVGHPPETVSHECENPM